MSKSPARSQGYLATQIMVGVLGLIMSIVLHEAFHILVHWGEIKHISVFPNSSAIVEIDVHMPIGYDIDGEEMAAYAITLLTIIVTIMIIFKIQDAHDKRTASQILFPKDKKMQRLKPSQMLSLSGLSEGQGKSRKSSHKKK